MLLRLSFLAMIRAMMIEICDNKAAWERGGATTAHAEFLQSWEWGEFQRATGKEVIRMQVVEGGEVVNQVQEFVHRLGPGFNYLYSSRYAINDKRYLKDLCGYIKGLGFVFWRVEPISELSAMSYELSATPNRQPQHTLILDLTKSLEELLQGMHPKTRYNIHLAEKKGVRVVDGKNSEVFWRLNQETSARDRFKSHGKEYYEKMLASPITHQLIAYFDSEPIASHILVVFGDTATYLHGASGNTARNKMAPYLLQWAGIQFAKGRSCRYYDLWGVAPLKNPKSCFNGYCWDATHPWTGITRFKVGFGGEPRSYPPAVDIVFQPMKYKLYQLARKFL